MKKTISNIFCDCCSENLNDDEGHQILGLRHLNKKIDLCEDCGENRPEYAKIRCPKCTAWLKTMEEVLG